MDGARTVLWKENGLTTSCLHNGVDLVLAAFLIPPCRGSLPPRPPCRDSPSSPPMLSLFARRLPLARPRAVRAFASANPPPLEGEQLITAKLTAKFAPSHLQVQDVSGGCGSFYAITIASEAFKGLSIVKQHKLVTETLKQEIEGIHGLQIKTLAQ
ncbi:hypothetical protein D9615_000115 [Tricholomella constricta]|uniref:Bola-like protein n=1 Tax=Tricholomella constricta TaxID=117010 RepID=A0A8H5HSB3_9AGAR|nr:hypothetical protein D9615_000115 [Tricholomella constricta]